jgi:hypothetical protein
MARRAARSLLYAAALRTLAQLFACLSGTINATID